MKKMYSLIAIAMVVVGVKAQTTIFNATFDDVTGTGGTDGLFSGSAANSALNDYSTGGIWSLTKAFKGNACLKVGTGSALGSITTPSISLTGSGILTFRAGAWDGNNEKLNMKVTATGATLSTATATLTKGSLKDFTINITGATGSVKLTFEGEAAANSRFFIDDIKIVQQTMAVVDATQSKANLVKNTIVSNDLVFGTSAKVSVYNTAGQVVKAAEVTENSKLDVSALPKGTYIVTGLVNGQTVSQKILKK